MLRKFLIGATVASFALAAQVEAQVKVGGRLLAFVGASPVMKLRLVTRETEEAYGSADLLETDLPLLQNGSATERFSF